MKTLKTFIILLSLIGQVALCNELFETKIPFGKIYTAQESSLGTAFNNIFGAANILFYGKKGIFYPSKKVIYFSCVDDYCEELELVTAVLRHEKEDEGNHDFIETHFKVKHTQVQELLRVMSLDVNELAEVMLEEGLYQNTDEISRIPESPLIVAPLTVASVAFDTLKSPFWKVYKQARSNKLDKNTKKIIKNLLDDTRKGEFEKVNNRLLGKVKGLFLKSDYRK